MLGARMGWLERREAAEWSIALFGLALVTGAFVTPMVLAGSDESGGPGNPVGLAVPQPEVTISPASAPSAHASISPSELTWGPLTNERLIWRPVIASRQQGAEVARSRLPSSPRTLYVSTQSGALHMRREPDAASTSRGAYPPGTPVVVLEEASGWARVIAPDGAWGWMAADYLSEADPLAAVD